MSSPCVVVNLNVEPYDVYIGRAGSSVSSGDGYWGNPFRLKEERDREWVLSLYRSYFDKRVAQDALFRARLLTLRGKRIGCYCHPKLCHGDVIAEWVNAQDNKEET